MKKYEFSNGPLNKSLFTQEYELIVKALLEKPEACAIVKEASSVHFKIEECDLDINLTALLRRVNFSHLSFNEIDSEKYLIQYESPLSDKVRENRDISLANIEGFTKAEFDAIGGYACDDYYLINKILHNDSNIFIDSNDDFLTFKEAVVKTAFIASGLNKMPVDLSDINLYRGDKPTEAMIQERIAMASEEGGISEFPAFMSTSVEKKIAFAFGLDYMLGEYYIIHFNAPYGKDFLTLGFNSEAEYLINPSTILWTGYELLERSEVALLFSFGNNSEVIWTEEVVTRPIHIFHAEVVEPLIHGKDDFSQNDLETFSALKDWADHNEVSTDFITPYITTHLQDPIVDFDVL